MARLDPSELRDRLAHDSEVVRGLRSDSLGRIAAFTSPQNLAANREATSEELAAGRGELYLVEYCFPMLSGPRDRITGASVQFDLLAGGNYPYTEPAVHVVSRPLPWNPHVAGNGWFCVGGGWRRARGKKLLGEFIAHIARLLNWDEPFRGSSHDAFDLRTLDYWRDVLRHGSLNSDLSYPVLPTELTHGVANEDAAFIPSVADDACFAPAASCLSVDLSVSGDFAPVLDAPSSNNVESGPGDFLPVRWP